MEELIIKKQITKKCWDSLPPDPLWIFFVTEVSMVALVIKSVKHIMPRKKSVWRVELNRTIRRDRSIASGLPISERCLEKTTVRKINDIVFIRKLNLRY